uniref:Calmodulin n=1 Tax=Macrostomum lignano TaxID=282301 RepID=A0A1I8F511_9PLAT
NRRRISERRGSVLWQNFSRNFRSALIETRLRAKRRRLQRRRQRGRRQRTAATASTGPDGTESCSVKKSPGVQQQQLRYQQLRARRRWHLLRQNLGRVVQAAQQKDDLSVRIAKPQQQQQLTGWELFSRPPDRESLYSRYSCGHGGVTAASAAVIANLPSAPDQPMATVGLPALPAASRSHRITGAKWTEKQWKLLKKQQLKKQPKEQPKKRVKQQIKQVKQQMKQQMKQVKQLKKQQKKLKAAEEAAEEQVKAAEEAAEAAEEAAERSSLKQPKKQLKEAARRRAKSSEEAAEEAKLKQLKKQLESEPLPEEETQRRPTRIRFQEGTDSFEVPEHYHEALSAAGVSAEEAKKYYRTFKLFRRAMDPTASMPESFTAAPESQEEIQQMLSESDTDASGSMEFVEFASLMSRLCKPEADVRQQLVSSFQVFDKDQSGYLDREELRDAIYSMGRWSFSEEEFDELLSRRLDKRRRPHAASTMKSLPRFF